MSMPVRVTGFAADGHPWTEMCTVKDASASGLAFSMTHPIRQGHVLHLALSLPKRFRSYDLGEASYHVYSLVRTVRPDGAGARVGVMFLGRNPPRHFDRNPSGRYLLPNDAPPPRPPAASPDSGAVKAVGAPAAEAAGTASFPDQGRERREHSRLDMFVNIRLTRQDGVPGPLEERTIAENISRGGARVLSALDVKAGEILMLTEVDGDFETRVEVRRVYLGPDHVARLNLKFLDAQAPDRLVATS